MQLWSMPKTKLDCEKLSDREWSVTKTRQDNDMINRKSVIYAKNKTKLS